MNNSPNELDIDPAALAEELIPDMPGTRNKPLLAGNAEPPKASSARIVSPQTKFSRLSRKDRNKLLKPVLARHRSQRKS